MLLGRESELELLDPVRLGPVGPARLQVEEAPLAPIHRIFLVRLDHEGIDADDLAALLAVDGCLHAREATHNRPGEE